MAIYVGKVNLHWKQLPGEGVLRNVETSGQAARKLRRREVWRIGGDNRWRTITCHSGEIWITQQGDLHDYLLSAGDIFLVTLPGLVLVEAREEASVEVGTPMKHVPYRGEQRFFG